MTSTSVIHAISAFNLTAEVPRNVLHEPFKQLWKERPILARRGNRLMDEVTRTSS